MSLRYRIALTVFCLELVMLALVLWSTLTFSLREFTAQAEKSEAVVVSLLGDLSRRAFLTAEYSELQPYVEKVALDPMVVRVRIADDRGRIVVSTFPSEIGRELSLQEADAQSHWRTLALANVAGPLGTVAVQFSQAPLTQALARARRVGVAVAAGGIGVSLIVSLGIGWLLTRRLRRVAATTEQFAAGDRHARTRERGSDEVALVGAAFDAMAGRIEAQMTALIQSERRFHDLLDRMDDLLIQLSPDGATLLSNRVWHHTLGVTPEAAAQLRLVDLVAPDRRDEIEGLIDALVADGEQRHIEFALRLDDETELLVDGVFTRVEGATDGYSVLAVLRDITETRRIAHELAEREEQLRQAQKLQDLGRLVGGIAHDFNNILTVILGDSEQLALELGDDPRAELVRDLSEAAGRAASLTSQLLAFSRQHLTNRVAVDVNRELVGLETLLRRLIREDIRLEVSLAPELPPVQADPVQLQQVVLNLAVNARDSMPDGGSLAIRTALVEWTPPEASDAAPLDFVLLTLSDTGSGMDADTREHVFDPFFTTKSHGQGTGLGLSTVYGIVRNFHGYVELDSEPGAGTRVRVYLPASESDPLETSAPTIAGEKRVRGGTETVLVVEDEQPVRRLIVRMLSEIGYRVLEASGVEPARKLVATLESEVDLVLTDVVMPHGSGFDLARELRRERPELPVLFMSGYAQTADGEADLPSGSFIAKPFTSSGLAERVRSLLDECVRQRKNDPESTDA